MAPTCTNFVCCAPTFFTRNVNHEETQFPHKIYIHVVKMQQTLLTVLPILMQVSQRTSVFVETYWTGRQWRTWAAVTSLVPIPNQAAHTTAEGRGTYSPSTWPVSAIIIWPLFNLIIVCFFLLVRYVSLPYFFPPFSYLAIIICNITNLQKKC